MRRLVVLAAALTLSACSGGEDGLPEAGDPARASSTVVVDYVGRLEDGTVFDEGERVEFPLQAVVPGFRDGIVGMQEGEEKTIVVPPEAGYGARGVPGSIPPNATLTFDVMLREVR